jgi:hypothetical protein
MPRTDPTPGGDPQRPDARSTGGQVPTGDQQTSDEPVVTLVHTPDLQVPHGRLAVSSLHQLQTHNGVAFVAAYRHRDGDREVTVSLDPQGENRVEVNVSHGGVLAWTVTTGPDVPDSVVAAIAYTALTAKHRDRDATATPDNTPEPGSTLGA